MAGWVEKRSEGRWRLNVPGGSGTNGERIVHRKMVGAKGEREARKLLDLFSAEVQKGQYVAPSKLTFKEFAERWLRDYGETNLAPKTLDRYKRMLDSRIIPAFELLKLEQIRPFHLLEFYKNLQEDGIREDGKEGVLSPKTILHHHRLISAMLNDAVEWELIGSNPASKVKPPKVAKKQAECYDEEQTAALLAAAEIEPLRYRLMINLAVFTGLRRGELMGLEWRDINLEAGTLEVRQASQYVAGKGTFTKEPKNETSKRVLALPPFVIDLLKLHKEDLEEQAQSIDDRWIGSERLFVTWDGRPMHPDTISQWFPKFLTRHNLPPLPFHGLRHTAATLLIGQGLNAKNISARMGHADIGTTYNIYGHALKSADREAADKLNELYNGKLKKKEGPATQEEPAQRSAKKTRLRLVK
ncbi:MAG: site-specific integrase [Eubacteriales bacterium]